MKQFNRNCSLRLRNNEEALDLSGLRVQFEIHQALVGVPNWAKITVYNLSLETQREALEEFTDIDLAVGYGDDIARLFYGQVRQFNGGLQIDAKSTYIDFICQTGDFAQNWTAVARTLAAGWTYSDAMLELSEQFARNGAPEGYMAPLPVLRFPRGKVMYGAAKDHMTHISDNISADWSIENGRLTVIPYDETLPGEAVVVNGETGLIGLPQQTADGITLRMLINTNVQNGSLIRLNNEDIQTAQLNTAAQATNYFPGLDKDGLYKVYSIDHIGDTRGNDWYSDVICVGLNANTPITPTYRTTIPNRGTTQL